MSKMLIPKRVRIDNKWHEVHKGWTTGKLELADWGGPIMYTTKQPYPILHENWHFVYDMNGNKMGEFLVENKRCAGCVKDLEM